MQCYSCGRVLIKLKKCLHNERYLCCFCGDIYLLKSGQKEPYLIQNKNGSYTVISDKE